MISFSQWLEALKRQGYSEPKARSKIAHDVVLMAMEKSGLKRNATIKGGVVMSDLTGDIRRATMDMDVDLVRYSLDDARIARFIERLNCLEGIDIVRVGQIAELRQRDYRGKRVRLSITDSERFAVQTKIDFGVHTKKELAQPERGFKISLDDRQAKLPANSIEQVFAEKLKSLLIFGTRSGRAKDVFDMCHLATVVDGEKLGFALKVFVFGDSAMRERDINDIVKRLDNIFRSRIFMGKLRKTDANWLDIPPEAATDKILSFIKSLAQNW